MGLTVSGVCNENVVISFRTSDITIDGLGSAIIQAATSSRPAVLIRGRGIQLRGFYVSGGGDGVLVLDGGFAFVYQNTIEANAGWGVQVSGTSSARIWSNTVSSNAGGGVLVNHASNAFIGFPSYGVAVASPNIIQNNPGGAGIQITASSSAVIIGNFISGNGFEGILVNRASQAETASNAIDGNGRDGIRIVLNSAASLGRDTGTTIYDAPNVTTVPNSGFGFNCSSGGASFGRLGSLTGVAGPASISSTCAGSLL